MMQQQIEQILRDKLTPMHLEIRNESHMHNVPEGSESHFKVVIVTDRFTGQNLVARHREVNRLLSDQFQSGLHALALHTMTPDEWFAKGGSTPDSPLCMGGSKQQQDDQ